MELRDLTWLVGGPQGGGINASAETLTKACTRAGYRVTANIEYHSNIMGEHSYYRVRIADEDKTSISERVHVLVALDEETLFGEAHPPFPTFQGHVNELVPGGAVVFDASIAQDKVLARRNDILACPLPYTEILEEMLSEFGRSGQGGRMRVMVNTIATGASLALMGFPLKRFQDGLREGFSGRRAEIGEMNARAAEIGFNYLTEHFLKDFQFRLVQVTAPETPPLFIRGMQACAIAKLKAGLGIQTYYPISPATDENVYLEAHQRETDLVVVQTEDEISAINMAVGAAHGGARVSTSTSGPGFSLMVEGIGFASMTEAAGPVVMIWSRGGPSTGLPTRQEQGDLRFMLQPGHGEFPHILVAPGDVDEVVEDAYESFNWADRYQLPVIVLCDKLLSTLYVTHDGLKLDALPPIDRGKYRDASRDGRNGAGDHEYLRYAITEDGITPRSIPGDEGGVYWTTTDEHDPRGHITEDAQNRIDMMHKRMGKLALALSELPEHRTYTVIGPEDAEVTLVGWGSTKGAILDALKILKDEDGITANYLHVRLMRPFPVAGVEAVLKRAKRVILVETNYLGQLGMLIREQTGITISERVLKFDGRPFSQEEIMDGLRSVIKNGQRDVAVSHLSS
ncbi:MAG: 2-oxoacid:acceptor oxidoreductase subunit alpha [Chloroflexota bacterium]